MVSESRFFDPLVLDVGLIGSNHLQQQGVGHGTRNN